MSTYVLRNVNSLHSCTKGVKNTNTYVIRNTLNELLARHSSLSWVFLPGSLKIQGKTKEEAKYYFCSLEITTEEDKARSWWFDLWTQFRKYA